MAKLCPTPIIADPAGPDDFVRALEALPAVPIVLTRLMRLLESECSTTSDVIDLIMIDSGIAARVLRIGSSAYYATPEGRCETVEEAVKRIGFIQVQKVVSFVAASDLLLRPLVAYGLTPEDAFRRSVTCALAADHLADHVGVNRGIAYTAGLLHGLGLIAVDLWTRSFRPELRFESDGLPNETSEAERRALGFSNAAVGGALLKLWDFPVSLVEPVACQYDPRAAKEEPLLACLLHVAKWLRDAAHLPDEAPLPPLPAPAILDTLRLIPSALEIGLYQVRAAYHETARVLQAG